MRQVFWLQDNHIIVDGWARSLAAAAAASAWGRRGADLTVARALPSPRAGAPLSPPREPSPATRTLDEIATSFAFTAVRVPPSSPGGGFGGRVFAAAAAGSWAVCFAPGDAVTPLSSSSRLVLFLARSSPPLPITSPLLPIGWAGGGARSSGRRLAGVLPNRLGGRRLHRRCYCRPRFLAHWSGPKGLRERRGRARYIELDLQNDQSHHAFLGMLRAKLFLLGSRDAKRWLCATPLSRALFAYDVNHPLLGVSGAELRLLGSHDAIRRALVANPLARTSCF